MIRYLLLIALIVSLGMNAYLYSALKQTQQEYTPSAAVVSNNQRGVIQNTAADSNSRGSSFRDMQPQAVASAPVTLEALLEQGRYSDMESRLQTALRQSPNDIELLLLEGQLMVRTRPLSEAILHLFSLRDLPLTRSQRQQLDERIHDLVSTAVSQLKASENWDLLAQFLEPLFQIMPAHRPYILQLAEAYARQNKPTLMEDVLASLLSNDPQANKIRGMLPAASDREPTIAYPSDPVSMDNQRGIVIQLEPDGSHFIADVRIASEHARLMLDTGATTTAITQQLFERLSARQSLPFVGNFEVNTAAGRVSASMVQVPVVGFGPLRFTDLSVLVLPENTMRDADGLLGMNMMQNMDFRLNQQTGELTLYPHQP